MANNTFADDTFSSPKNITEELSQIENDVEDEEKQNGEAHKAPQSPLKKFLFITLGIVAVVSITLSAFLLSTDNHSDNDSPTDNTALSSCQADSDCLGLEPFCNEGFCAILPELVGCYNDNGGDRIFLNYNNSGISILDNESEWETFNCGKRCAYHGFLRFGIEKGLEDCWCGNDALPKWGLNEQCVCSADGVQNTNRSSMCVYATRDYNPVHIGCYNESQDNFQYSIDANMSFQPLSCESRCKAEGFLYFGLSEQGKCWCSDSLFADQGFSSGCACDDEENQGSGVRCVYKPIDILSIRIHGLESLCEIEVYDSVGKRVSTMQPNQGYSTAIVDNKKDSCSLDPIWEGYTHNLTNSKLVLVHDINVVKEGLDTGSVDLIINGGEPTYTLEENCSLLACESKDAGINFSCRSDMKISAFQLRSQEPKNLCEIGVIEVNTNSPGVLFDYGPNHSASLAAFDDDISTCMISTSSTSFSVLHNASTTLSINIAHLSSDLDGLHIFHSDNTWETTLYGGVTDVRIHEREVLASATELKTKVKAAEVLFTTFELKVDEVFTLDFDIPENVGVKLAGLGDDTDILINGTVNVFGRLEIMNATVSFENEGVLEASNNGAVHFQDCGLLEVDRCNDDMVETSSGKCLGVVRRIAPQEKSAELCEDYFDAEVATVQSLSISDLQLLIMNPETAWVQANDNNNECTVIQHDGSTTIESCDSLLPTICNSIPKIAIKGNRMLCDSSYISVSTTADLYHQLTSNQLETNTCSLVRVDVADDSVLYDFQYLDPPQEVQIVVDLEEGEETGVNIAIDTDESVTLGNATHVMGIKNAYELPSVLQIHASSRICVKSVSIKLHGTVAIKHSAKSLMDCYNVCNIDNISSCSTELAVYDSLNECIVLDPHSVNIPRDLSIRTSVVGVCNRLSIWNHPSLGEAPFLTIQTSNLQSNEATFHIVPGTLPIKYRFQSIFAGETRSLPISSFTNDFSPQFTLNLEEGNLLLESIQVSRYGNTIMSWNASETYDCINICPAVTSRSYLELESAHMLSQAIFILDGEGCEKFVEGFRKDLTSATNLCTGPPLNISSFSELTASLKYDSDDQYRTITLELDNTFNLVTTIQVPSNRGLTFYSGGDIVFNQGIIVVNQNGYLKMNKVNLNGTFSIQNEGNIDLYNMEINTAGTVLVNSGTAEISAVSFLGNSSIENEGELVLRYSDFLDDSSVVNSGGKVQFSRMNLADDFNLPEGAIILPDARRIYTYSQDADLQDRRALVEASVSIVNANNIAECQDLCENTPDCFAVGHNFITGECGLCTGDPESTCYIEGIELIYFNSQSQFEYIKVNVCLSFEEEIELISFDVNEEKCKAFCEYYETCEAVKLDGLDETFSCNLISSLDATTDNCSVGTDSTLIPYDSYSVGAFLKLNGTKVDTTLAVQTFENLNVYQCAKICEITISCSAFVVENLFCMLFEDPEYLWSGNENDSLYISFRESFPLNAYVALSDCKLPNYFETVSTKSEAQCRIACDSDQSCRAYAYPSKLPEDSPPFCYLYDIYDLVNGVLGDESKCDSEAGYDLHIAFSVHDYKNPEVYQANTFDVENIIDGLDIDTCKSLCFYDVNCTMYQYDDETASCELGKSFIDYDGNQTNYYVSRATPSATAVYVSTSACIIDIEEIDTTDITIPKLNSYVHHPLQCITGNDIGTFLTASVNECKGLCTSDPECFAFVYGTDYGSENYTETIGQCQLKNSLDYSDCDGLENNLDLYLKEDAMVCQLFCNIHPLCSSFSYGTQCRLFSDIEITQEGCIDPIRIHIGVSTKYRDTMMYISGGCLVPFEELNSGEFECYNDSYSNDGVFGAKQYSDDTVTMHSCREYCRSAQDISGNQYMYYGVKNGDECYCGLDTHEDYSRFGRSTECASTCSGDSGQKCGGPSAMQVGRTNIPLTGYSLEECKAACYASRDCVAMEYDTDKEECELHSSSAYTTEDCQLTSKQLYIESLEHFYLKPASNFFGITVIDTATTSKLGCQALCDVYEECSTILFSDTSTDGYVKDNCEIYSDDGVYAVDQTNLTMDDELAGFLVANDIALFTRGFKKPATLLADLGKLFDVDECMRACEDHVLCGSFTFKRTNGCKLYHVADFADTSKQYPGLQYFVSYQYYLDPSQEFVSAAGAQGKMCIGNELSTIAERLTTQSTYDCARRCNDVDECTVFTFDASSTACKMYNNTVELSTSCFNEGDLTANLMFTRAKFTNKEGACLLNENVDGDYKFEKKTFQECAALCDAWFQCRSFRHDTDELTCLLFQSEQFSSTECPDLTGSLYVYYSDEQYTQLSSDFCVAGVEFMEIENTPLEACKKICTFHPDCQAFEHNEGGDCALFYSGDFSSTCASNNGRNLYISYANVVDSTLTKFVYSSPNVCFDTTSITNTGDLCCRRACSLKDSCYGYQENDNGCYLLTDENELPSLTECSSDEEAFIRARTNPYKMMNNTCLRNVINLPSMTDLEDFECMNLCNVHPFCRYYIYGDEADEAAKPSLRECVLFRAQAYELDDCNEYVGEYQDKLAMVNGRTFIDQITWFGEPDSEIATLPALSYQECSSLCDSLESCDAFVHSWNYRRYGDAIEQQLFTKSRLIHHDSFAAIQSAQILKYDQETSDLVITYAQNDDDVHDQLVLLENIGDETYRMKFWSANGLCLHGSEIERFTLDEDVECAFEALGAKIPDAFCQSLLLKECTDSPLELTIKDTDGTLEIEYSDNGFIGCIQLRPDESQSTDKIRINRRMEDISYGQMLQSYSRNLDIVSDLQKCGFDVIQDPDALDQLQDDIDNSVDSYENFATTTCGTKSTNSDSRNIFSSSYDRNSGCNFDSSNYVFPSQWWYFVSEKVRVYSINSEMCLTVTGTLVELGSCDDATAWTYVFGRNQMFFDDSSNNDKMKCLEATTNGLTFSNCRGDGTLREPFSQRQIYFDPEAGTLSRSDYTTSTNDCLIASEDGEISWGSCDDNGARWTRYSECKLTSRTNTKAMKLENQNTGKCFSDTATFIACDDTSAQYQYYYGDNVARIEQVGSSPSQCIGRDNSGKASIVDCFDTSGSLNVGALWHLDGDENNVFRFNFIPGQDYCLGSDNDPSCSSGFSSSEKFKADGHNGDATEISVKPSAALQQVTDPELLFQFWLYSPEGAIVRHLRAKIASLGRVVEETVPHFENAILLGQALDTAILAALSPIDSFEEDLNTAENIFNVLEVILRVLEVIPTVGGIVKSTRLRSILGQLASKVDKLGDGVDKFSDKASLIAEPVSGATDAFTKIMDVLHVITDQLPDFVEKLAREMFCAWDSDNNAFYYKSRSWANELMEVTGEITNFLKGLPDYLKPITNTLNKLKPAFNTVEKVLDALSGVLGFLGHLDFLEDIYNWKMDIPVVDIGWKTKKVKVLGFKVKIKVPSIDFDDKPFGLEEIGDFLNWLEKKIKNIPGIGYLYSEAEELIEKVVGALFSFSPFQININQDYAVIEEIIDFYEEVTDTIDEWEQKIGDIINSQIVERVADSELLEKAKNAVENIQDAVDCDGADCMFQKVFDIIPEVSLNQSRFAPELNIPDFTDLYDLDYFEDLFESIPGLDDFFDSIECNDYTTSTFKHPLFKDACEVEVTTCSSLSFDQSLMDTTVLVDKFNEIMGDPARADIAERRLRSLSDDIGDAAVNYGKERLSYTEDLLMQMGFQISLSLTGLITTATEDFAAKLFPKFMRFEAKNPLGSFLQRFGDLLSEEHCFYLPAGFEFCPKIDFIATFSFHPFRDDSENWFDISDGGLKFQFREEFKVRKRFHIAQNRPGAVITSKADIFRSVWGGVNMVLKQGYDQSHQAINSYAHRTIYHILTAYLVEMKSFFRSENFHVSYSASYKNCFAEFINHWGKITSCSNRNYRTCEAKWYKRKFIHSYYLPRCVNFISKFTKSLKSQTPKDYEVNIFYTGKDRGPFERIMILRKDINALWHKEAVYLKGLNRYSHKIRQLTIPGASLPRRGSIRIPKPEICKDTSDATGLAACIGSGFVSTGNFVLKWLMNGYWDWGYYDKIATLGPYNAFGLRIDHQILHLANFYVSIVEGYPMNGWKILQWAGNAVSQIIRQRQNGNKFQEIAKATEFVETQFIFMQPIINQNDFRLLEEEDGNCTDLLIHE